MGVLRIALADGKVLSHHRPRRDTLAELERYSGQATDQPLTSCIGACAIKWRRKLIAVYSIRVGVALPRSTCLRRYQHHD
jgi:hypothetical protein